MSSSDPCHSIVKIGDKSIVLKNPNAGNDAQIQKKPKKVLNEETYSEVHYIITKHFRILHVFNLLRGTKRDWGNHE